jgi:hypothetical protein
MDFSANIIWILDAVVDKASGLILVLGGSILYP